MRRAIYEDDVIKLLDKGWKTGVYPVASNIHALPPAQPEVRTQMSSADWQAAIEALKALEEKPKALEDDYDFGRRQMLETCIDIIQDLQPSTSAQPEPISEAYAKAVMTWLVQYQIKCAELQGRYTPYEVLGWIVNDWRKDNGISQ